MSEAAEIDKRSKHELASLLLSDVQNGPLPQALKPTPLLTANAVASSRLCRGRWGSFIQPHTGVGWRDGEKRHTTVLE